MIPIPNPIARSLVLISLCLFLGALFSFLGIQCLNWFYGVAWTDVHALFNHLDLPENIQAVKLLQFFNGVGLFVVPGILFALFFIQNPMQYLQVKKGLSLYQIGFVLLLFVLMIPVINVLVEWNEQMVLPDALAGIEEWMRDSENQAKRITKAFLAMDGVPDLWINIVLIGLIPAVGEELIFRGFLQQFISERTKNYHIGIWVSAILFSALHLQFFGFFPRLLLGAFFGYLFVWTSNLWVPMLAHFINNTSALLIAYFMGLEAMEEQFDQVGTTENSPFLSVLAIILFGFMLMQFRKAQKNPDR